MLVHSRKANRGKERVSSISKQPYERTSSSFRLVVRQAKFHKLSPMLISIMIVIIEAAISTPMKYRRLASTRAANLLQVCPQQADHVGHALTQHRRGAPERATAVAAGSAHVGHDVQPGVIQRTARALHSKKVPVATNAYLQHAHCSPSRPCTP
jgi:hypothetical protein